MNLTLYTTATITMLLLLPLLPIALLLTLHKIITTMTPVLNSCYYMTYTVLSTTGTTCYTYIILPIITIPLTIYYHYPILPLLQLLQLPISISNDTNEEREREQLWRGTKGTSFIAVNVTFYCNSYVMVRIMLTIALMMKRVKFHLSVCLIFVDVCYYLFLLQSHYHWKCLYR